MPTVPRVALDRYPSGPITFTAIFAVMCLSGNVTFAQTADQEFLIGQDNEIVAVYTETPPRIDGVVDDPIWQQTVPARDFVQLDPNEGAAPSYPSAIRIAFDEKNLYFGLSLGYMRRGERLLRMVGHMWANLAGLTVCR